MALGAEGIQHAADHRGEVVIGGLFLAQGIVGRNLHCGALVFCEGARRIEVGFADFAIHADASEVVDDHRRVWMLLAHRVNAWQVLGVDQAGHDLPCFRAAPPHRRHAFAFQPLVAANPRSDPHRANALRQQLAHHLVRMGLRVIDHARDHEPARKPFGAVDQIAVVPAVIKVVLDEDRAGQPSPARQPSTVPQA